jgi:outer membrane protein OmpA-like peptidoglycan-associated protein
MNNPIVTSLLVALVVTGGILAGGYLGFDKLQTVFQGGEPETQSVIIELKNVAIGEIHAVKTEAIDEIKKLNVDIAASIGKLQPSATDNLNSSILRDLKHAVDNIHSKHEAIVEQLSKLMKLPTKVVAAPPQPQKPEIEATQSHTVYFQLGAAQGPKIDTQVAKFIPGLMKYAMNRQCQTNISGFSDTLGNDDNNLKLSQMRADYVASRLKSVGLSVATVRGWRERRLKVHTLDGADNENNRRVIIEMNCNTPMA